MAQTTHPATPNNSFNLPRKETDFRHKSKADREARG